MYNQRSLILAIALLVLCTIAAVLLAGVVALGMSLDRSVAAGAFALSVVLFLGAVALHKALREARWDAGLRLR